MAEPQNDSTLRWIFKQLMGEGISEAINRDAPLEPARPDTIGPVNRRFNPEDPTAFLRDLIREKTEEYQGTPQGWLPSDLLSLISQPAGPEGANPLNQAINFGPIPRDWARRFASETATEMRQHPAWNAMIPRTTDMMADMVERHPEATGQLSNLGLVLDPGTKARYSRIPHEPGKRGEFDEMLEKIIRRDPTTYHPPTNQWIQSTGRNLSDEELMRTVQSLMGKFEWNPALEIQGAPEAYKAARHEFQHLFDDLRSRLPYHQGPMDQTYWIDPTEVRARAAEGNFGRDLGPRIPSIGKPWALRHRPPLGQTGKGRIVSYPELISGELDVGLREVMGAPNRLSMPPNFEDKLQSAVDYFFTGPNAKLKKPAPTTAFPGFWESFFK